MLIGRKVWIVAIALGFGGYAGWMESAPIRGQLAARYDLSRGRFVVLEMGEESSFFPDYVRLLRDRYGVEVRRGVMAEPQVAYAAAYDEVTMAAANLKFGHDIFRETLVEAANTWRRSHHPPKSSSR